jgi:hypothetical protein
MVKYAIVHEFFDFFLLIAIMFLFRPTERPDLFKAGFNELLYVISVLNSN